MKKTALIVGNSNYKGGAFLKNPVNDATDICDSLKRLGFSVILQLNSTNEELDRSIQKFQKNLDISDIGLFYFAGHGVQVSGVNYLVAVDSKTKDETSLKHSATSLDYILDVMDRCKNETNIVILDACRDNPFERRWSRDQSLRGFASVYAPKGTIISFSTSPGQVAADGVTDNSPFAYALLSHISTANISIEELFKRVRETVMATTNHQQVSWEHTSLVGNFQFNSGNFISVETGYDGFAVADSLFISKESLVEQIIDALRTYDWYRQNPAIDKISNLQPNEIDKSLLFLLGRNILQSADGGARYAKRLLNNVPEIRRFTIGQENHLLNGILFEIYFDSDGKFRTEGFKSTLIGQVLDNYQTSEFLTSINFIREQLLIYSDDLFIIPSIPPETLSLNLVFEEKKERSRIREILYQGKNILKLDKRDEQYGYYTIEYNDYCNELAVQLAIPNQQIVFTNNLGLSDRDKIGKPFESVISKY